MRKYLSIALVALMVFACGTALAYDAGYPSRGDLFTQTATIGNYGATEDKGHTHVTTGPTLVWQVTFTSSVANTYVQLFDSNGTWGSASTAAHISSNMAPATGANKFLKADLGAATANQSYVYKFDPPIRFEQGLLAGIAGASNTTSGLAASTAATAVIQYTSAE